MSDGEPTDNWQAAAQECREAQAANKVAVFPISVGKEATESMGHFSRSGINGVKQLKGLQFRELFLWLSASMQVVSQSTPGGKAQLPPTDSWSEISV